MAASTASSKQSSSLSFNFSKAMSDICYIHSGKFFKPDPKYLLDGFKEILKSEVILDSQYRDNVLFHFKHFVQYPTEKKVKEKFNRIFNDETRDLGENERLIQRYFPIVSEAVLQRKYFSTYSTAAFNDLNAFQAIVDNIFHLALENKVAAVRAPLVYWSKDTKGPVAITAAQFQKAFAVDFGTVCLPLRFQNGGLLAWSTMGHEVAGHHFIQGKPGLLDELIQHVESGFETKLQALCKTVNESELNKLLEYWTMRSRVEEVASDILGVLSTGPSLAIGLIGYFRGKSKNECLRRSGPFRAKGKSRVLHIEGVETNLYISCLSKDIKPASKGVVGKNRAGQNIEYRVHKIPGDPHPIEVLRPFTMFKAISVNQKEWVKYIKGELGSKELLKEENITLIEGDESKPVPQEKRLKIPCEVACLSAQVTGDIIANEKLKVLEGRSLSEIFKWTVQDERMVENTRKVFGKSDHPPRKAQAKHIVAAAVMEACKGEKDIGNLFQSMKRWLANSRNTATYPNKQRSKKV